MLFVVFFSVAYLPVVFLLRGDLGLLRRHKKREVDLDYKSAK